VILRGTLPDDLTVSPDFTDAVEGDSPRLAGLVHEFKHAALAGWKANFLQSDPVDYAFPAIAPQPSVGVGCGGRRELAQAITCQPVGW
jgi:hypothetical protein